jgi:type I restriction enzyme M protein
MPGCTSPWRRRCSPKLRARFRAAPTGPPWIAPITRWPGVFSSAGAGVKTNLLFFTKGGPTERTWYFDLSDVKVTKKQPLTLDRFEELFALAPSLADSPRSWTVTREELEARGYDLKAVNPTAKAPGDTRTPLELLDEIEARGIDVDAAVARLRALLADVRH